MRLHRLASPIARRLLGTVTRVSTSDPVVAITFDDGPHPEVTPRLLEILREHGARATFFMVGEAASRHPDVVKRVAEEGHAIGNHSWDHSSFVTLTGRQRRTQMRAGSQAVAGYGDPLFRPPYGEQSIRSRVDALLLGYEVIAWSKCAHDWHGEEPGVIADRLSGQLEPGDIVLLHDSLYSPRGVDDRSLDREPTLKAVDMLLETWGDRLSFVTIPELMRRGRVVRELWFWPVAAGSTDIS